MCIYWRYGLDCHQCVDDTQLCLLMDGCLALDPAPENLGEALQAMARWLQQNQLKLNPLKMEILYLGCGD